MQHITPGQLDELLGTDGYSLKNIEETNIKHPIDNYNLLKRTARTWRKIKDTVDSDQVKNQVGREHWTLIFTQSLFRYFGYFY